jgi:3-oxoacyl-ACP reductase-like protein
MHSEKSISFGTEARAQEPAKRREAVDATVRQLIRSALAQSRSQSRKVPAESRDRSAPERTSRIASSVQERKATMNRFSEKAAIVTGSAVGIARACAQRMAEDGAQVAAG